jgi:hypothetical protein
MRRERKMAVLKLNGGARAALVALVMLASSSQAALAATTKLVCLWPVDSGLITLELNEAKRTATIHYPAGTDTFAMPKRYFPAHSEGPIAATFGSKTVTFDIVKSSDGNTTYQHFVLDRVTLAFTFDQGYNAPFDQAERRGSYLSNCDDADKAKALLEQATCHC